MIDTDRRDMIALIAALGLAPSSALAAGLADFGTAAPFSWELLQQRAEALASQPYREPAKIAAAADHRLRRGRRHRLSRRSDDRRRHPPVPGRQICADADPASHRREWPGARGQFLTRHVHLERRKGARHVRHSGDVARRQERLAGLPGRVLFSQRRRAGPIWPVRARPGDRYRDRRQRRNSPPSPISGSRRTGRGPTPSTRCSTGRA